MRARRRKPESAEVVNEIRSKLEAPILNGGFDTVLEKLETIHQNVKKLNDAVYDPDTGLYFRIQKGQTKFESDTIKLETKVQHLENRLDFYKKVVIGAAGTTLTVFLKFVWDIIGAHVTFH